MMWNNLLEQMNMNCWPWTTWNLGIKPPLCVPMRMTHSTFRTERITEIHATAYVWRTNETIESPTNRRTDDPTNLSTWPEIMARPSKMKWPSMVPEVSETDPVAVGDVATVRQLQAWIQKDPEAVLNQQNRLWVHQHSTMQMYDDLVERVEVSIVKVKALEEEFRRH